LFGVEVSGTTGSPRESAEVRGSEALREQFESPLVDYEIEGGEGVAMYQFSRAIYRELAPYIATPGSAGPIAGSATSDCNRHARVLHACESTIERMATDRHYFANPARTLFCDIRMHFPMNSQAYVHKVVSQYIALAQRYLKENPRAAYAAISDEPPRCRAMTRKGAACQRTPLAHNGYCPSHQHLADTEDRAPLAA
jgi:hypothetical protein